jgi:UDPglucose--hexose-1-phosphate uridylyltransferase
MHELRKDPILQRWVVVLSDDSKPPSFYCADRRRGIPPRAPCPLCEISGDTVEIFRIPDADASKPPRVRVVANNHPILQIEGTLGRRGIGMYDAMNGIGASEIVIESPFHDVEPDERRIENLSLVLETYRRRIEDLQKDMRLRYVLAFKNYGRAAGAVYDHPHSQIVATPITPRAVKDELYGARTHFGLKERCVFCDILREERRAGSRIIAENRDFIAFVPYAPRFPFEIWILPNEHQHSYVSLVDEQTPNLASIISLCARKLGAVLEDPPYNMVLHTSPNKIPRPGHWLTLDDDYHWHIELLPNLLTHAGFEWGSGLHVLATTPEDAARYLREAR